MDVIILGDPHLGKSLAIGKVGIGSTLNSRVADQLHLLDWTLEQAIDLLVSDIIITGDVFEDPQPHPSLISLFINWLKKCHANNINVHVIFGNHDILRSGFVYTSPLDIIGEMELDNVFIYKDINTIIIGTSAFTLVPFRDRKSFGVGSATEALSLLQHTLTYELSSIPKTYTKVLVGHLAIEGSIPIGDEIDDLTNELFCSTDMFNGYDYVWMGHVHKPQIMKKKNPYIAHVGSMDISNFGETDHKKNIIIFNANSSEKKDIWTSSCLPTRPLKKISITVPKDTEDSTAYVLEELQKINELDKAIIKVEVSLISPELKSINKKNIETYLMSKGAFSISQISENKKTSLIKKDEKNTLDTKMDTSSAIKAYADKYISDLDKSSFIELAMEIYNIYKLESKA